MFEKIPNRERSYRHLLCDFQLIMLGARAMGIGPMTTSRYPLVVVWDFDWSMIDENTDTWIIEQLADGSDIINEMKNATKIPVWTDRVNEALRCLHAQGVKRQELLDKLKTIAVHPGMKTAVQLLHEAGAYQIILSDSNSEFIKCILEEHNLYWMIDEVITNPASFSEDGRLIARTHQPPEDPHGCSNCPPQLCKGLQFTKALQRINSDERTRFVYVGDGAGDFCPCLQFT